MHGFLAAHWIALTYGGLAFAALGAVWRAGPVRAIGWALVVAWLLSNAVALTLDFDWRLATFPLIDLMIAFIAQQVWRRTGYKLAALVIVLSMINCLVNIATAVVAIQYATEPGEPMQSLHKILTNIIFGGKCLLVTAWGVADAHGLFNRRDAVPDRDQPTAGARMDEAGQ